MVMMVIDAGDGDSDDGDSDDDDSYDDDHVDYYDNDDTKKSKMFLSNSRMI